jgi:transposase
MNELEQVFGWVLHWLAEHRLIRGERIGVDASTMETNAALRSVVRRDAARAIARCLTRTAKESGIATPTADHLVGLDCAPRAGNGRTPAGKARSIPTRGSPS